MNSYNIRTGQNTVLRGLIAEEFARYVLIQRYPIIVMRPTIVLQCLQKNGFQSSSVQFLEKYQQTMDYFGIAPIILENEPLLSAEEVIIRFFQAKNGLSRYIEKFSREQKLKGYIIEVKSRTSVSSWPPFHSSFSPNQELMLEEVEKLSFEVVLCGVTFEPNWNLSIVFYNQKGKILPHDYFSLQS